MRVYNKNQTIPMDDVTWDMVCDKATLVTDEDPGIDWPDHIWKRRELASQHMKEFSSDMDRRIRIYNRLILPLAFVVIVACVFISVAGAVFEYRNPLSNQMSFYRDFKAVVTFQKLPEYQIGSN